MRPGSEWRTLFDTTRDPIIAARDPLPWPSWQRSEDYYSEGALIWLDVDTRIRELSGDMRSLNDFAQLFFGQNEGSFATDTYVFEDLVGLLNELAPYDWAGYFHTQLEQTREGTPLDGLGRGGYALIFRDTPNAYAKGSTALSGLIDLSFSIGLKVSQDGTLQDVAWGGPGFEAGLTIVTQILAVNGRAFSPDVLEDAVAATAHDKPLDLLVKKKQQLRSVMISYTGGLRYPHLERISGTRARMDEIFAPLV